jgi:hypothetical protein
MSDVTRFTIGEEFGRAKKPIRQPMPNYFELHWEVDYEREPDYEPDVPPLEGELRLEYFELEYKEWVWLLHRFDAGEVAYEETRPLVRSVAFRSFPAAFRLWEELMGRFVKDEIVPGDVVRLMVEASQKARPNG